MACEDTAPSLSRRDMVNSVLIGMEIQGYISSSPGMPVKENMDGVVLLKVGRLISRSII